MLYAGVKRAALKPEGFTAPRVSALAKDINRVSALEAGSRLNLPVVFFLLQGRDHTTPGTVPAGPLRKGT